MTKVATSVTTAKPWELSQDRTSDRTDEQLLASYRNAADRAAFAELVERYERELYSYLRRYLSDACLAEDAFQMTFLQVHLKCDQFDDERKFRPWLYTIATNQAIDAQRRARRHRKLSLDRPSGSRSDDDEVASLVTSLASREDNPAANYETARQCEWVRGAVEGLPDALRGALTLVYYQGLKYREAADVLGVPVGTVKSRVHSAILKLNEEWIAVESMLTN